MNVFHRSAAPLRAAGYQLKFDDAFGAVERGNGAVQILRREGHVDADGLLQRFENFRLADNLCEMRRADFFFAFGDEDKVHGEFLAGAANRMERREKCGFRPFLIDGAAAHENFADSGPVDDRGVERR